MSNFTTTPLGIEGEASHRSLHFFWLIDWSYSMQGTKIQRVNWAIRDVLPEIQKIEDSERVKIYMRAIRFGDKAEWHVGPDPVPVADFQWKDMEATGGSTGTAAAVNLLVDALRVDKIGLRNVPPVCILLSDGYCTDTQATYEAAIKALDDATWGKKAVRLSIGIGEHEGDYNKAELDAFISPYLRKEGQIETLHADTPRKLVQFIRLASVVATTSASKSSMKGDDGAVVNPVSIHKQALEDTGAPDLGFGDASEVF
ncbi:MAG: VWA domain-containing protein [Halothiobacillaceae bacterium]